MADCGHNTYELHKTHGALNLALQPDLIILNEEKNLTPPTDKILRCAQDDRQGTGTSVLLCLHRNAIYVRQASTLLVGFVILNEVKNLTPPTDRSFAALRMTGRELDLPVTFFNRSSLHDAPLMRVVTSFSSVIISLQVN